MKYEITINYTTTIEADDEQEAMEEIIMNYQIDKHDLDIEEIEEEEEIELTYNQEHKEEHKESEANNE
tara:strand:- start:1169 stop:1372 length:204 start_codon:yes stop_codon:yes gene_type:complete